MRATAQQQAAKIPGGISQAADGSMILDATVSVNSLPIRFKIAAPAEQFTAASKVPGAAAAGGANGTMGTFSSIPPIAIPAIILWEDAC